MVLDGIDPAGLLIGLGVATAAADKPTSLSSISGTFRIFRSPCSIRTSFGGQSCREGRRPARFAPESSCVKVSSPTLPPSGGHGRELFRDDEPDARLAPVEVNDGWFLGTVWIRNSRRRVKWLITSPVCSRPSGEPQGMPEFLLAAAGFVLAMVALGLIRILRGPKRADRMMAAQLLGTGGIGALLLAAGGGLPAAVDVALRWPFGRFCLDRICQELRARELDGSNRRRNYRPH